MNILLTGQPGVGQTTCIRAVVNMLADATSTAQPHGFYTSERRQRGVRVGFDMVCVASGDTAPLASVAATSASGEPRVGKYTVHAAELQRFAVPRLALDAGAGLIICDEIGKMELCSSTFLPQVRHPDTRLHSVRQ